MSLNTKLKPVHVAAICIMIFAFLKHYFDNQKTPTIKKMERAHREQNPVFAVICIPAGDHLEIVEIMQPGRPGEYLCRSENGNEFLAHKNYLTFLN